MCHPFFYKSIFDKLECNWVWVKKKWEGVKLPKKSLRNLVSHDSNLRNRVNILGNFDLTPMNRLYKIIGNIGQTFYFAISGDGNAPKSSCCLLYCISQNICKWRNKNEEYWKQEKKRKQTEIFSTIFKGDWVRTI